MRETIIVTEFAWLDNPPPYPKGVMDPAKFGDQNTTLAPQAVALNYAAADGFDEIETWRNSTSVSIRIPCKNGTLCGHIRRDGPFCMRTYKSFPCESV